MLKTIRFFSSGSALFIVCILTILFFSFYTLPSPYFLDTFGYLEWINTYMETGQSIGSYRITDSYFYFYPVVLFGEIGIKITTVIIISVFSVCYFLLIKRDFSTLIATGATLILLTAPTTVITVTHLKEDYNSLLFLTLAILAIGNLPNMAKGFLAGIFYGLSLLLKELPIIVFPFLIAYIYIKQHPDYKGYKDFLNIHKLLKSLPIAIALIIGIVLIVGLIAPGRYNDFFIMAKSPYMGEFLGFFSSLQVTGYFLWNEGILYLYPWYAIFIVSVAYAIWKKNIILILYFLTFLVIFLFLSNNTVIQSRHYAPALFFLAPLIINGLLVTGRTTLNLVYRKSITDNDGYPILNVLILIAAISLSALQLSYVMPTLEYRIKYNPQQEFYSELRKKLPENALLMGMDNCPIARYYSGFECIHHPVDISNDDYVVFAARVKKRIQHQPLFLLPDFFVYDKHAVLQKRFPKDFQLQAVYSKLGEDYHAMTYGRTMDSMIKSVQQSSSCRYLKHEKQPTPVTNDLELELGTYWFSCDGKTLSRQMFEYKGHSTFLMSLSIYSVRNRSAR